MNRIATVVAMALLPAVVAGCSTAAPPDPTAELLGEWSIVTRIGQGSMDATMIIEPGSPWENGYCESFNGKLRDEQLAREIFYTLEEAKVLFERWRREYNTIRPHSALGYPGAGPGSDRDRC